MSLTLEPIVRASAAALPALLLGGCALFARPAERVAEIDASWREGHVAADSLEELLDAIHDMPAWEGGEAAAGLAQVPGLASLSLTSPSDLVRAEALRTAWQLGAEIPLEPWRTDELTPADFNTRTRRLQALIDLELASPGPELLELAGWIGRYRFEPGQARQAVTLAEVVAGHAALDSGALAEAFATVAPGSVRHALALATAQAASDDVAFVRLEAQRAARHLPPELALQVVQEMLPREEDALVVLAGLESLGLVSGSLPPGALRELLEPLQDTTDVAVRRTVRELLARAS